MNKVRVGTVLALVLASSLFSQAQQAMVAGTNAVVPPLVKFGGTLADINGKPLNGTVGVTFLLYKDEQGGAPLWLETQNVAADKNGHYSVMLGATRSAGLPADIFVAGEARWLAVQPEGQSEQPRVLLLSVPYALKAGDAQTLGGLPASAFVQAAPAKSGTLATVTKPAASAAGVTPNIAGSGTTHFLPVWTSTTNLGNSTVFQAGTQIGINTTSPGATLSVIGNGSFTANSNAQALSVTQAGGTGSGVIASTNATNGIGVSGTSSSTSSSVIGGIGVYGFSSNPSGYGVEGTSGNIGVYGTGGSIGGTTGVGVQGMGDQYGVYGSVSSSLFPANQAGVYGTTASASATAFGVEGTATATTGSSVGVLGKSSSPSGYGVEGLSSNVGLYGQGNYGIDAHGSLAGVKGVATAAGGFSGLFQGGPVSVAGNGNRALLGDPGCGSGYAGIGFNTGNLSCTNYALLGGSAGGTYINSSGTAFIHFRSNNNELAHIDNSGNMDIEGINGGGNLKVTGRVTSGNVIAAATASSSVELTCTGVLTASNTACAVPNMSLTKTTANPSVLVMVNIGGVITDSCATANFYLVVDGKISALSSISLNSNNSAGGYEIGNVNIVSLLNLSAGSHTFQVQQSTDETNASCNKFTLQTTVGQGDGGRGSQRSLVVREF